LVEQISTLKEYLKIINDQTETQEFQDKFDNFRFIVTDKYERKYLNKELELVKQELLESSSLNKEVIQGVI
jgi:uncharacterized protein YktA (UPF0223 family)